MTSISSATTSHIASMHVLRETRDQQTLEGELVQELLEQAVQVAQAAPGSVGHRVDVRA